jgi:catechol 2,3-dioxygenase
MSKRLLAHLAHVELLTPKLDQSVEFFKDTMGLTESGRAGDSVYLRCWGEFYHHSVVLTAAKQPGLDHAAWRTLGPEELSEAVSRIEARGVRGEWIEKSIGHGRAYRFRGPGGHVHEVFWDVERFMAPPEQRSTYPERAQRFIGRGIAARQLDHITIAIAKIKDACEWYRDTLGFRFMATTSLDEDPDIIVFAVVTTNEKSHDLGLAIDLSQVAGRIHHLSFWVDSQEDLLRAADILLDSGTPIEFGPGRHGIGEQSYLYFREPGGLRLEINTGGYRNYVPDWEPVHWHPSQGSNTMYRNVGMPNSMMEAFPPAPEPVMPDADLEPTVTGVKNPWVKHG